MYSASKINFTFYLFETFFLCCFSVASIADDHGGYNIEHPISTRSTKLVGTSGKKSDIKLRSVQRSCKCNLTNTITTKGLVNLQNICAEDG